MNSIHTDPKIVLNPRKISIGHKVRILVPKFLERVGYDIAYADVKKEMFDSSSKLKDSKLQELIDTFSKDIDEYQNGKKQTSKISWLNFDVCSYDEAFKKKVKGLVVNEITYNKVAERMAAGDQVRKKYEVEKEEMKGVTFEVTKKTTAVTGKRFASSGGGYYDDYEDWEPGGLADAKTHVFLEGMYSDPGKIDASYVERVIEKEVIEGRGWFRRYYHNLSWRQKRDILELFIKPAVPLSVKKIQEVIEYMKNDLIFLLELSDAEDQVSIDDLIKNLLSFMKSIDVAWVLSNHNLFEIFGYDWIGNKDIRNEILFKKEEGERVLNKSF